eukprot:COSAG06_NODE_683_length_13114_cov_7.121322_4_plen_126_part_00
MQKKTRRNRFPFSVSFRAPVTDHQPAPTAAPSKPRRRICTTGTTTIRSQAVVGSAARHTVSCGSGGRGASEVVFAGRPLVLSTGEGLRLFVGAQQPVLSRQQKKSANCGRVEVVAHAGAVWCGME